MCGETDAWDGDECKVCDYTAPPKKFQDPDVDLHKQLDLRGSDTQDMSAGDVNSAVNDQDGDGFDDETGEPITEEDEMGADDMQPALACPVCGYEAEAAEPTSISTEDPEAGSSGGGPVEGDLCPNCQEGLMESSESLGMGMEGEGPDEGQQQPGEEPDPDEVEDEMDDDSSPFPSKDENEQAEPEEDPEADDEEDDDEEWPPSKKPARR